MSEATNRERIRIAVQAVHVNKVGQEGRGGAEAVREDVLRILDKEWAAQDAELARRTALLAALRAELASRLSELSGMSTPDRVAYVADYLTGALAMFVLSVDDHTWEPVP